MRKPYLIFFSHISFDFILEKSTIVFEKSIDNIANLFNLSYPLLLRNLNLLIENIYTSNICTYI